MPKSLIFIENVCFILPDTVIVLTSFVPSKINPKPDMGPVVH